ncbi:hypothetical protein ACHAXS_008272 [Conticribra weissflogii]
MTTTPPEGAIRLIKSISSLRGLKRLTRALATSILATVFPQFRPSLGAVLPGLVVATAPASARSSSSSFSASSCDHSPSCTSSSLLSFLHEALFSRWNSEPAAATSNKEKQQQQQDGAGENCGGYPVKMAFSAGMPVIRRCGSNGNFGGSSAKTSFAFVSNNYVSHSSSLATVRSISTDATSKVSHPLSPTSVLSSSSSSDSCRNSSSTQKYHQHQNQKFSTSTSSSSSSSSKLSSTRAQNVLSLLPSYLLDARAITKYHPINSPDGALQLSVAENQLSELPILDLSCAESDDHSKVVTLIEDGEVAAMETADTESIIARNENVNKGMTLVDVLSQLAGSTAPRPSSSPILQSAQSQMEVPVFEKDMIYYQPTQGVPGVRKSMAEYLQNLLVAPHHIATDGTSGNSVNDGARSATMNPENIILGAGCNAVLENLCMCLVEPGEAVMIPTPYYAAFEFDLVARAGCHIVPVNTFQHHPETPPQNTSTPASTSHHHQPIPITSYYPNRSSLDRAYERTLAETSRPPRVLLLSHPNNPLGICYPPDVVKECIDWCREKEVHLISDEIYAGSVYRTERGEEADGEGATFVSAMALAANHDTHATSSTEAGLGLGPYIHLVYALSKDFALSGLRVGVAYTENPEILVPMQKLNDLCQISSQTQLLVERMLSARVLTDSGTDSSSNHQFQPKQFVDVYLKSNQANIRSRCDKLLKCLDDVDIPYLPADSGLFVWMDFREFLPTNSDIDGATGEETLKSKERRDRQLFMSQMKEYGLLFTPGMSMRNERAGFFRCVFTAASEDEFELGLERIREFVEKERHG